MDSSVFTPPTEEAATKQLMPKEWRESGICLRCRLCPQKSQMCLDVSAARVVDEPADVCLI